MSGPLARDGSVADHHRPAYHPRPPRGYLNDPNGPIAVGDVTHLYFQSRPTTDVSAPVMWGHLTSSDLVRWRLHRPAMAPLPDGLDRDGCYSGNTVLDDGRVRAFYSGLRHESPYQSVLTAVSDDGGHSFGPPSQVIPDPSPEDQAIMFRDPFVWAVEDGWRMVVGAGYADGRSAVRLYASTDLRDWVSLGDGASLPRQADHGPFAGDAWECPQVFDLAGRSIAVAGTWSVRTGVNRVISFVMGEEPTELAVVDHGTNFYAPSALRESRFGPLLFGWITEGRSAARWIEAGWAGVLSIPRQVWLGADDSVRSSPVRTVDGLRVGPPQRADGATVGAQFELVVPAAPAQVCLCFGETERLTIVLDDRADTVLVDRSAASTDDEADDETFVASGAFADSGRPAGRIFVDGSIVEVFTSAGRVLTTRVYPVSAPPWRVEASEGCTVWELDAGDR